MNLPNLPLVPPENVRLKMPRNWISRIRYDTSDIRIPQVGDQFDSPYDRIEITFVSYPETFNGKTDRMIHAKVIKVRDRNNSSMDYQNIKTFYGVLFSGIPYYNLVDAFQERLDLVRLRIARRGW